MIIISEQAFLFLTCVKTGIIMGILYDIIRVIRRIVEHPNWIVHVEDLLYWITCGCFAFVMIFWKNYGQIRSFVFLGILIGGILYFSTVSSYFIKIITQIIKSFIIVPIGCIIKVIIIPFRYLYNIYLNINKKCKKQKNKILNQLKVIRVKK